MGKNWVLMHGVKLLQHFAAGAIWYLSRTLEMYKLLLFVWRITLPK